jgi:signal transduction histidine kinase
VILKANDDPGFGMVTISVQDTGVGIPQADVAKLFEIEDFHAISSIGKEQGSGLGLTICKEMVARNKGKIWAHSKLGQGTTVSFTVPRAEQTSG